MNSPAAACMTDDTGEEDGYYDSIASGYDDLHGDEQQKKMREILEALGSEAPGKDDLLLDVGCGSGISTSVWQCSCTGIDPSKELIKIAREKYPDRKFIVGEAESLPFPNDSFDAVISITSMHNFNDIRKGIAEMKRVGKNLFVISVLRKSEKIEEIEKLVIINFKVRKMIMEDKDLIFICGKLGKQ